MAANSRTAAAIQHTIQYPSGHLDRWAAFGSPFEMPEARPMDQPNQPETLSNPADQADDLADQATEQSIVDPKKFILAGDATFTLQGLKARYTFNVRRSDPGSDGGSVLFVSLLTGPDNGSDYSYIGLLDGSTGQIRLTRKSRLTADSGPVRAFNWAVGRIWQGRAIEPARILFASRCGRCGRRLTVTGSIVAGFGPECLAKMGGA